MCVSQPRGCNSLWLPPRPLAGGTVGLAGLSKALERLGSSARLRRWQWAHLHVRLERRSRKLLAERPSAPKTGTESWCVFTGSRDSSTKGSGLKREATDIYASLFARCSPFPYNALLAGGGVHCTVKTMLQHCQVYLSSLRLFLTLESASITDSLMVFKQQMHHISQTTCTEC